MSLQPFMLLLAMLPAQTADAPVAYTNAVLRTPLDDAETIKEFENLYALPEGEVLRRIAPPFSSTRLSYYHAKFADQAKAIPAGPDAMVFRWNKQGLQNWGMNFGEYRLADLLNSLFGVFPHEIEGDAALRKKRVGGDFVIREGESPAKLAARLQ